MTLITFMLITAFPHPYSVGDHEVENFVRNTLSLWKSEFSDSGNLMVARVDIRFRADPENFVKAEGAVISPIGVDIPNGQKIIKYAAYPPPLRELTVDGIKSLAWLYPGKCRRNLHFVSLCLVKTTNKDRVIFPDNPTFDSLPKSYLNDALATAYELEEHSLHECSAFKEWPGKIAGEGEYTQQFKTIVETVASGISTKKDDDQNPDDICAAMRKLKFSGHRAHVLSVMACRQLGIPCYGFISATEDENYYIGTYSEQSGWIYFNLMDPEQGFITNPPVFLTHAPLITEFAGCNHGYWFANANAYQSSEWGTMGITYTKWGRKHIETDYTIAQTYRLDDWKR
jgi:hypothetical protein